MKDGLVTATEAARALGMPASRMFENIRRGKVSCKRYGHSTVVNLEQARKELEESGFFMRRARYTSKEREPWPE